MFIDQVGRWPTTRSGAATLKTVAGERVPLNPMKHIPYGALALPCAERKRIGVE